MYFTLSRRLAPPGKGSPRLGKHDEEQEADASVVAMPPRLTRIGAKCAKKGMERKRSERSCQPQPIVKTDRRRLSGGGDLYDYRDRSALAGNVEKCIRPVEKKRALALATATRPRDR